MQRAMPTIDPKFGNCTALSTSSPVLDEALKFVTVKVESRSDFIAAIKVPVPMYRLCT